MNLSTMPSNALVALLIGESFVRFYLSRRIGSVGAGQGVRLGGEGVVKPMVVGFVAPSGTGKTTLICRLLPLLREKGLRVGAIKHTHHDFEVDHPGKDSFRLRKAGASQVQLLSDHRWALVTERNSPEATSLVQAIERMDSARLDLILVEGYRNTHYSKIELYRAEMGEDPLYPRDDGVIAVATAGTLPVPTRLPVLPLDDARRICDYLTDRLPRIRDRPGRA